MTRTVGAGVKWLLAKENGDGFEVEDHARIEETEARIAEMLGLDNGRPLAEQFKLVIGPFQNDFLGPFVIKQPTKRQEAFDEILGIDAWRKTYKGTSWPAFGRTGANEGSGGRGGGQTGTIGGTAGKESRTGNDQKRC